MPLTSREVIRHETIDFLGLCDLSCWYDQEEFRRGCHSDLSRGDYVGTGRGGWRPLHHFRV